MGGLQLAHKWTDSGCHWRPWILTSELAARMLTLGRTRRVGGCRGCLEEGLSCHPLLSFFLSFSQDDKTTASEAFSRCSFIPRARLRDMTPLKNLERGILEKMSR